MKYLYLHGLGQTSDSWNRVIKETNVSDDSICISLTKMIKNRAATYRELYASFIKVCEEQKEEMVLCGLSLGGVLALNYAIDYPQKVKALILIAVPYKMPKKLLKIQNILFHLMPESMFWQTGFGKADVISLCRTMADLDFYGSLQQISCPVLLVCGEKDYINKKASKELASYLSHASFRELPRTGHEANLESPEQLSAVLQGFYEKIESD